MTSPDQTPAKQLINAPESVMPQLVEGLLLTTPGLSRVDGEQVLVRQDFLAVRDRQVALISGGGSGHEPAHAGYLGHGMLSAAVLGDVFSSPSAASVLAAIRTVTGAAGCLLIVKNYTGDRLNFGLAAEQAKSEYGLKVEMLIVGDDVALPDSPQPRGIAGTVFVHKVAGAAAVAGLGLAEVLAEAQRAAGLVRSLGLSLSGCTLPGHAPDTRLGAGEVELGLGIHGEGGVQRRPLASADELSALVADTLLASPRLRGTGLEAGCRCAALVNNLGTLTPMEMLIVTRGLVARLREKGLTIERLYSGPFMTSLDMRGFSLSLLPLDDRLLERLDSATDAPAWTRGVQPGDAGRVLPRPAVHEEPLSRAADQTAQMRRLETAIRAAAQALITHEAELTAWDKQVGDGDCGTTLRRGAERVLADLPGYPLQRPDQTFLALARSVSASMGGSTGVLYGILFRAAHQAMQSGQPAWEALFGAGVAALGEYGGAAAGDRTMLDALLPASQVIGASTGRSSAQRLAEAATAAEQGADATRHMQSARAGRSAYLGADTLKGTPDPGAMAVAFWLRALASSLAEG